MTIKVVMEGSSVRVLVDEQVPAGALTAPPEKLGMFAQADVDWGFKKAPSPRPMPELDREKAGVIKLAALNYVKGLLEAEINSLKSQL